MAEESASQDLLDPRRTALLMGHRAAVEIFLKSYAAGRLHHAWLLSGPKGIGKATLAYHLARFLLRIGAGDQGLFGADGPGNGASALAMAADDPIFTHVASGADGNLKVIERGLNEKTKRLRQEIIVDDVRALHEFFELTASHEGWRIAIIDSADEMNRNAANALLKMLEEPPRKSILFLISHAKGRLPATIRSRCQQLPLKPLAGAEVSAVLKHSFPDMDGDKIHALARLSGGAPGLATRLALEQGLSLYEMVAALLDGKHLKTKEKHDFASALGARGADERYFLFLELLRTAIAARLRTEASAGANREGQKTPLDCWLGLWEKVNLIERQGEGLNLGRKQAVLVLLEALEGAGGRAAA